MTAFVGSIITAITWVVGSNVHPWLAATGTALLTVTIPLLIAAGFCLDSLDRDDGPSGSDKEK